MLRALRDHDEILADELDSLRYELGRHKGTTTDIPSKIIISVPAIVGERFLQSVKTTLIKSTTSSWEEAFGELAAYKATHGHCNVPQLFITENGMKLGQWVINQRTRKTSLSADRIQRLENLGFVWDSNEAAWEKGFTQLVAYKATYGDCNVPVKFVTENGMKLGQWVDRQRQFYKNGKLSADRIQRLEALDFVWDMRNSETS